HTRFSRDWSSDVCSSDLIPLIVRVPAFFYLLFWIGMNVINALKEMQLSFTDTASAGVAWWAHIGGFAIGMIYAGVLAKKQPAERSEERRVGKEGRGGGGA